MIKSKKYVQFLISAMLTMVLQTQFIPAQDRNQRNEKPEQEEPDRKIFFGGNFALMIGSITNIEISPLVGYRLTPRLSAGAGITYAYYREKFTGYNTYESHIYGGRIFASWLAIRDLNALIGLPGRGGIFGYTEYEALNMDDNYRTTLLINSQSKREWFHNIYIGGGYKQPIGRNASLNIMVLWNLNQSPKLPYDNPTIRIGFYL